MFFAKFPKNAAVALIVIAYMSHQTASAQPSEREGGRRGPPPEAFEACAEKASGDSCEMTGRKGEQLQGSCILPPEEDETLVCAPEGGAGHGRGTKN